MTPEVAFPKRRLLIVDDEVAILFAMDDYLSRRGYVVDLARSLEEAERCSPPAGTMSSSPTCGWGPPSLGVVWKCCRQRKYRRPTRRSC